MAEGHGNLKEVCEENYTIKQSVKTYNLKIDCNWKENY